MVSGLFPSSMPRTVNKHVNRHGDSQASLDLRVIHYGSVESSGVQLEV